jgi:hypothetical protein
MTAKQSIAIKANSCAPLKNAQKPFMLVLDKGQRLIESILACANSAKLHSASFSGLGAIENPTLSYYEDSTKQYKTQTFEGSYELISLTGNITELDGKLIAHAHVALGDERYQLIAGHLNEAMVSITAEITIIPFDAPITRKLNPVFNLNLIEAE